MHAVPCEDFKVLHLQKEAKSKGKKIPVVPNKKGAIGIGVIPEAFLKQGSHSNMG